MNTVPEWVRRDWYRAALYRSPPPSVPIDYSLFGRLSLPDKRQGL
jgi:hypothetical protein